MTFLRMPGSKALPSAFWPLSSLVLALAIAGCGPAAPPSTAVPSASAPAPTPPNASVNKEDIPPESATGFRKLEGVVAGKFMVASANPHASEAGRSILQQGGSAVDAAIAMAVVLTLVEPQSSGIGGGGFLLHYAQDEDVVAAYDGRETAPASATPDLFLRSGKPRDFFDAVVGGLSVGVPGELRMLERAHKEHGKLPWAQLFAPAIALCTDGFSLSPRLFSLLARDPALPKMALAKDYFYGADGKPKPVGTKLKNPELAEVLKAVATGGADAFYTGPIAKKIVDAVQQSANPGRLSIADMENYQPKKRQALCAPYRSFEVCGMPPPSSGGITTLQILRLLEPHELEKAPPYGPASIHLFAEAGRLAYADRDLYVADPDFAKVPTEALLDAGYLTTRSQLIHRDRSMGVAKAGKPEGTARLRLVPDDSIELPSTSHLVAVDAEGNAVSMTASIETAFGAHVMVSGFLLNNQLTDFSFVPEVDGTPVNNRVQPGKRPRSSMAPILVFDRATASDQRTFRMSIGSPGGSRIIAYVARVLVSVLAWDMELQDAIGRPNVANRNGPTELEDHPEYKQWTSDTKAALQRWGHEVQVQNMNSGLHGIVKTPEGYRGAADPRREGIVLGN